MATYLSLEDAARKLGIPVEKLIDLRSHGQVRGFRDGASWKFPETEIERLKEDLPNLSGLGSGILDGPGYSSQSDELGDDSSLAIGDPITDDEGGSSLELGLELPDSPGGSDVNLVPGSGTGGSDVLVVSGSSSNLGSGGGLSDLDELNLSGSAVSHDSGELELGSDGGSNELSTDLS